MRTTVRLNDALLARAKREADRKGTTLTALFEAGLELVLARGESVPSATVRVSIPVSNALGGTLPGVDLTKGAQLLDRMEGLG